MFGLGIALGWYLPYALSFGFICYGLGMAAGGWATARGPNHWLGLFCLLLNIVGLVLVAIEFPLPWDYRVPFK